MAASNDADTDTLDSKHKFDTINSALNQSVEAIRALVNDADSLTKAALDGVLATRADASKHQGDYQKVINGINSTLDALINPLNVAANYISQISIGNIV